MSAPAERPNRLPWPPIIYGAAALVSIALGFVLPLPLGWPGWGLRLVVGLLLIAGAVALDIWAARAMRAADTTIMPHRRSSHLVTTGPFAWSRNPIYLANTMLMAGIGLIAGSFWFILFGFAAAIIVTELAIKREERHLAALFGEDYQRYRRDVRRWL